MSGADDLDSARWLGGELTCGTANGAPTFRANPYG
jgi:hypothetical protein